MNFFFQLRAVNAKIVSGFENNSVPLINCFLGFLFTLILAFSLEGFTKSNAAFNLPASMLTIDVIHFLLSYGTLAALLILMIHYATRTPIDALMRIVLPAFILLWMRPVIDLLLGDVSTLGTEYLEPGLGMVNVIQVYLSHIMNVSPGTICLSIVSLICIYAYFRVKKLNITFSIIYTILVYSIIFLWCASPFFISAIMDLTGFTYVFSLEMMIHFYLVVLLFLGMMLAYLASPKMFLLFAKDVRALRMLNYELMLLLGMTLALTGSSYDIGPQLYFSQDIIFNIFLCMVSLIFAGLFAIVVNNISDVEIDKISNTDRPLSNHQLDVNIYALFGYWFMAIAFVYSAMVSSQALLVMSVFMGAYYVYSAPPLRLKRITVLSKLVISINSLALVMLGYILVQKSLYDFPVALYWIFLVGFTFAANFIDLKDIKGDSAAGIVTLPVLLGDKKAKIIIGAAFWITYLATFYIIRNDYLIILLLIGGGVQFYLINRKPYNELPVLIFHNLSVAALILYLMVVKLYFS